MLYAIVPPKLKNTLTASLDKLVEKRFIQCLDPQDRTFCFPNQLIQATLYELTPPRCVCVCSVCVVCVSVCVVCVVCVVRYIVCRV